jgi:hypothetical protein
VSGYAALTLENVIEDAVSFVGFIKKNITGAADSKVLVTGGRSLRQTGVASQDKDTNYDIQVLMVEIWLSITASNVQTHSLVASLLHISQNRLGLWQLTQPSFALPNT